MLILDLVNVILQLKLPYSRQSFIGILTHCFNLHVIHVSCVVNSFSSGLDPITLFMLRSQFISECCMYACQGEYIQRLHDVLITRCNYCIVCIVTVFIYLFILCMYRGTIELGLVSAFHTKCEENKISCIHSKVMFSNLESIIP